MTPFTFLKTAVRDVHIGAVTRSSRFVVDRLARLLPPDCRTIIEYGPGDGVSTRALLRQLPGDGRLIAIERNPTFAAELRRLRDPRLTIVHGDVLQRTRNFSTLSTTPVDAIVSGIPLTLLEPTEREQLIQQTRPGLREGGRFLVYQYSPLVYPILLRTFRDVSLHFEPRNLLPYFIMVAER